MKNILSCRKEIQNALDKMLANNNPNYGPLLSGIKSTGLRVLYNPDTESHCIMIPEGVKVAAE